MSTRIAVATAIGCFAALPLLGLGPEYVGRAAGVQKPGKGPAPFATYTKLPSLGGPAEADGINDGGTVIVGRSFDRADLLYAVQWRLQNGTWVISALPAPVPYPGSAAARGIDTFGNVPVRSVDAVPPGLLARCRRIYFARLQQRCRRDAGDQRERPGHCRTSRRSSGGMEPRASVLHRVSASARSRGLRLALAVTGDGSIVGGRAGRVSQTQVPVRWRLTDGQWQVQQVDTRPGNVNGANDSGDLVGTVAIACPAVDGCQRAVIWSESGAVTSSGRWVGSTARRLTSTRRVRWSERARHHAESSPLTSGPPRRVWCSFPRTGAQYLSR